jgi:DNA-binding NtrC family response regulator
MERLRAHDWPGNVRQLANTLAVRGHALHHDQPWGGFEFSGTTNRTERDET